MGNDFHDERDNFQKSLDFTRIRCYTCNQLHKGIGRRVDVSSLFFVECHSFLVKDGFHSTSAGNFTVS